MNRYLVGFDIGTQGSKAILTDVSGNVIAKYQINHEIQVMRPGYQEEDMNIWWNEFKESIKHFLGLCNVLPEEIKAIGITGLVPGLCGIDRYGNAVRNAILHTDVRADKELEYLKKNVDEGITHGCMLPKLLWLRNNEKDSYSRLYKVMAPHSYIAYKLTGKVTMDYDTSTVIGGIFDNKKLQWKVDEIKKLDIDPNIFPEVYPANAVIGNLVKEAAEETGLSVNAKVIAGTGDSLASMVGGGAYTKRHLMIYMGTSTTIIYACGSPKDYLHLPHFENDRANFVGRIISFGESVSHLRNILGYENWDELEEGLKRTPAGAEGLFYIPHYKQQSGKSFFGSDAEYILGYRGKHNQFHIYRALIEGIAYNIRSNIETFNKEIEQINIFGGGAHSREICQIIADVLGRELHLSSKKGTALGIAFLAGFGSGEIENFDELQNWYEDDIIIKPRKENVVLYDELFIKYSLIKKNICELDSQLN